jgi:hypothetical protein
VRRLVGYSRAMTDDTIASPDHDGAGAPSAAAGDAASSVSSQAPAGVDADRAATGVVLVEEISIDGMCGVY